MKTKQMSISGMSCGHCAMTVKKELSKIDGVTVKTVVIGSAEVDVDELKVTDQKLRQAVEEAGYSVISIN
ncbi:MAG: heavy-metal-associated domain-containing protein [Bacteroidota bacterium]